MIIEIVWYMLEDSYASSSYVIFFAKCVSFVYDNSLYNTLHYIHKFGTFHQMEEYIWKDFLISIHLAFEKGLDSSYSFGDKLKILCLCTDIVFAF